jgi:hypothetical protein
MSATIDAGREIVPLPMVRSQRCVQEVTRASVVAAPGTGPVDQITATCARATLAMYVVRGGVLSRVARRTAPASPYGAPSVVSTGVDHLGPVAPEAIDGPLAWRSPLTGLDEHERDDVWAAVIQAPDGGEVQVLRGDALMPVGAVGLGEVVADARTATGVNVLASIARAEQTPTAVRVPIVLGRDEPGAPTDLVDEVPGELKAWEASRRVALARIEDADGAALEATWLGMHAPRVRYRLSSRYVLVVARGVEAAGRAVFVVGEFALGRGDAGVCMHLGEGMCVRATGMYLLVAGAPGSALTRIDVSEDGLPDALAARGGEVVVLYMAPDENALRDMRPAQHAVRVDVAHREVTPLTFAPPEGLGAIDGPTLVSCEDGVWMAAEVALPTSDAPDAATRSVVTALPLECLAR